MGPASRKKTTSRKKKINVGRLKHCAYGSVEKNSANLDTAGWCDGLTILPGKQYSST